MQLPVEVASCWSCLPPARHVCALPRLYGEFVWRFEQLAGAALPYHRFKRGDTVIMAVFQQQQGGNSSGDESDGGGSSSQGQQLVERLEGTVLELQREALLVTVSKATADALSAAGTGAWRVQREPEWQVG